MIYLSEELEGCSVYAPYTPDVPISEEPGLVRLTVGRRQNRR